MTWNVIFRAEPPMPRGWGYSADEIGFLYPAPPWTLDECSEHYRFLVASVRPPLNLCLPAWNGTELTGRPFCIDSHPSNDASGAWIVDCPWPLVDGEHVMLTLSPSVNVTGSYHGWVRGGVISDDVEGRGA